jgi:hypothetical protein
MAHVCVCMGIAWCDGLHPSGLVVERNSFFFFFFQKRCGKKERERESLEIETRNDFLAECRGAHAPKKPSPALPSIKYALNCDIFIYAQSENQFCVC